MAQLSGLRSFKCCCDQSSNFGFDVWRATWDPWASDFWDWTWDNTLILNDPVLGARITDWGAFETGVGPYLRPDYFDNEQLRGVLVRGSVFGGVEDSRFVDASASPALPVPQAVLDFELGNPVPAEDERGWLPRRILNSVDASGQEHVLASYFEIGDGSNSTDGNQWNFLRRQVHWFSTAGDSITLESTAGQRVDPPWNAVPRASNRVSYMGDGVVYTTGFNGVTYGEGARSGITIYDHSWTAQDLLDMQSGPSSFDDRIGPDKLGPYNGPNGADDSNSPDSATEQTRRMRVGDEWYHWAFAQHSQGLDFGVVRHYDYVPLLTGYRDDFDPNFPGQAQYSVSRRFVSRELVYGSVNKADGQTVAGSIETSVATLLHEDSYKLPGPLNLPDREVTERISLVLGPTIREVDAAHWAGQLRATRYFWRRYLWFDSYTEPSSGYQAPQSGDLISELAEPDWSNPANPSSQENTYIYQPPFGPSSILIYDSIAVENSNVAANPDYPDGPIQYQNDRVQPGNGTPFGTYTYLDLPVVDFLEERVKVAIGSNVVHDEPIRGGGWFPVTIDCPAGEGAYYQAVEYRLPTALRGYEPTVEVPSIAHSATFALSRPVSFAASPFKRLQVFACDEALEIADADPLLRSGSGTTADTGMHYAWLVCDSFEGGFGGEPPRQATIQTVSGERARIYTSSMGRLSPSGPDPIVSGSVSPRVDSEELLRVGHYTHDGKWGGLSSYGQAMPLSSVVNSREAVLSTYDNHTTTTVPPWVPVAGTNAGQLTIRLPYQPLPATKAIAFGRERYRGHGGYLEKRDQNGDLLWRVLGRTPGEPNTALDVTALLANEVMSSNARGLFTNLRFDEHLERTYRAFDPKWISHGLMEPVGGFAFASETGYPNRLNAWGESDVPGIAGVYLPASHPLCRVVGPDSTTLREG